LIGPAAGQASISGIAQLFYELNSQTVWPHLKDVASARLGMTLRKVGFEPATIHLPALRHSPPNNDGR
jgi:hypothetical protein